MKTIRSIDAEHFLYKVLGRSILPKRMSPFAQLLGIYWLLVRSAEMRGIGILGKQTFQTEPLPQSLYGLIAIETKIQTIHVFDRSVTTALHSPIKSWPMLSLEAIGQGV